MELDMKEFKFWQVDAFTDEPFRGNPAAIFILNENLQDELMLKIRPSPLFFKDIFRSSPLSNRPLKYKLCQTL